MGRSCVFRADAEPHASAAVGAEAKGQCVAGFEMAATTGGVLICRSVHTSWAGSDGRAAHGGLLATQGVQMP